MKLLGLKMYLFRLVHQINMIGYCFLMIKF